MSGRTTTLLGSFSIKLATRTTLERGGGRGERKGEIRRDKREGEGDRAGRYGTESDRGGEIGDRED